MLIAAMDATRTNGDEQFRFLADNATDMLSRHTTEGIFLYASPACHRLFGYRPEDLLGRSAYEFIHPDDVGYLLNRHQRVLAGPDIVDARFRLRRADGGHADVEATARMVKDAAGGIVEIHAVTREITDRRLLEDRVKDHERRYQALASAVPVGIYEADADFNCIFVNDRWCALSGMSREKARGLGWADALHPDDYDRVGDAWLRMASGGGEFNLEYRYLQPNGRVVWVSGRAVELQGENGEPASYLGTVSDVTDHRLLEDRLRRLADEDDLTGLANRRRFGEELQRHIERCNRYGWRGALLMLDLDRFKTINDTLGHGAGDRLMKELSAALSRRLRRSDFAARIGGDEFAVLLPEADRAEASATASAIVESLAPTGCAGSRSSTVSIGLAPIEGATTAEELMIRADLALYEAKRSGGNRFTVYRHGLGDRLARPQQD